MGRKITNPKLLPKKPTEQRVSAFHTFASKLVQSRQRKTQKMGDTKQRLLDSKKSTKMAKVSKRASRFALLDGQTTAGMTHRGKPIHEMTEFNDMEFGSQEEDQQQFQEIHQDLNFTGFNEEQRVKSKTEIYKQIMDKSKKHKHLRQEQYEHNLEAAVELDENFQELRKALKFRDKDTKVLQKLNNRDLKYDQLASQLEMDQRVVSNKIVEKKEKHIQKIRAKKNVQLNQLMKDSEEEGDVRDWIHQAVASQEEEQEESLDQLDDVQLSSEEDGDEEGEEDQEKEEDSQEDQSEEQDDEEQEEQEEQVDGDFQDDEEQIPSPKKKQKRI